MPQFTPTGGLSLIAHLSINVVAFLYRQTLAFFPRLQKRYDRQTPISYLTNKNGDNILRRTLAYTIVLGVLGSVVWTGSHVLESQVNKSSSNQPFVALEKVGSAAAILAQNAFSNDTKNNLFVSYGEPVHGNSNGDLLQTIINAAIENPGAAEDINSIVDVLRALDINPSFEIRQQLAEELGHVVDGNPYTGTREQNDRLLSDLTIILKQNTLQ